MAQSIREVMTSDPVCVEPSTPLTEVAKLMRDRDIGTILVKDSEFVGLVTDRDIVVRALADGRDPGSTQVEQVVTKDTATLSPEDSVDDAIRIVREHNVRRVPVLDGGTPVGIVSIGDLAQERDEHSALADLSAAPANN